MLKLAKNSNFGGVTIKGKKVVTLFTRVLFPIYREVKVGGLCGISIWDLVQVAVMVTRVMEIRFSSLRESAVGSFGRCLAPWKSVFLRQGRRRGCLGASCFEAGYARLITV
ncbi:unnamed protein product [Prunus armeniaca]